MALSAEAPAKRPARPHDPKGFVDAFDRLTGVNLSVRWVQAECAAGRIKSGGRGRYFIPVEEVERLARAMGLLADAEGAA